MADGSAQDDVPREPPDAAEVEHAAQTRRPARAAHRPQVFQPAQPVAQVLVAKISLAVVGRRNRNVVAVDGRNDRRFCEQRRSRGSTPATCTASR